MPTSNDPTATRRVLMAELRAARGDAGLTREEAVRSLQWSLSKLVRIETGDQGVSVTDLRAMLSLYGVADETRITELAQLAHGSRAHTWWSSYRDMISRQFGQYLSLEGSATRIRAFHPMLVPALLHTPEYGLELLKVGVGEERAPALLELRSKRQNRMFGQQQPPEMEFIFGEEALNRRIGSPDVMKDQCLRLLGLMAAPYVTIKIVPLSVGAHPGLSGSFILLTLQTTHEELLFLEGAGGDMVSRDERPVIDPFIDHFEQLSEIALSENATRSLIERNLEMLEQLG
jgi:transcriptional regulator with XRE-family HTH domain